MIDLKIEKNLFPVEGTTEKQTPIAKNEDEESLDLMSAPVVYQYDKNKNRKYIFKQFKLNWVFQKLTSRLMRGGNKEKIENLILKIKKMSLKKKKKYKFDVSFFESLFEKIKKYRPHLELSKKKKKWVKTALSQKKD